MRKIFDIKRYIIRDRDAMVNALERLSSRSRGEQFLLVLNAQSQLVGTLTDGDVRRGLLSGRDVSMAVEQFMHTTPVYKYVNANDSSGASACLNNQKDLTFLPVLNSDLTVNHITLDLKMEKNNSFALIMAGGFGKRLGCLTKSKPKALVEVNGLPLIEHTFRKLEAANFNRIFVSVHHLANMIEDYIERSGRQKRVSIIKESRPLGTAGAISLLPQLPVGNLLVTNCDLINNLDFDAIIDFHIASNCVATIAAVQHKYKVPFGVIKLDDYGDFHCIEEKPTINSYVAAGIYVFSNEVLRIETPKSQLAMPEFLNHLREKKHKIRMFPMFEDWSDVGRPTDLEKVRRKPR